MNMEQEAGTSAAGAADAADSGYYDDAYYESHYAHVFADAGYRQLLGEYWAHVLFDRHGVPREGEVLDYGCGPGHVSAALPRVTLFDHSPACRRLLQRHGLRAIESDAAIEADSFDAVLSSHSLEHSPNPAADLERFARWVRPGGRLVLVLPREPLGRPVLVPDSNRHLQCWNFQAITNLLVHTGWKPLMQGLVHGPWMLRRLNGMVGTRAAVRGASRLGAARRWFESIACIAEPVKRT